MGWWQRNIVEPGKLPLLLFAVAFIVTFLVTRTITRLIRAGKGPFRDNVTGSGLHIHHAVPGLVLLIIGTVLSFGAPPHAPWREIAAVLAGAGASLVLDEFALILHLDDVYWANEGQASVQAVALTAMCLLAVLVGFSPFGVDEVGRTESSVRIGTILGLVIVVGAVIVCADKGKHRLALFAVFIPMVAIVGAIRLARPGSRWARRRYSEEQIERATARASAFDNRWGPMWRRLGDAIAGSPDRPRQPGPQEVAEADAVG